LGELYIIAAEEAAGKTAICAGLAINLLNAGKKVGYLKLQAAGNDDDTSLMKQIPGLEIIDNESNPLKGRDIVLAEARLGKKASDIATRQAYEAAKEMKARVIVVDAYTSQPVKSVSLYKGFGENLMGVIINKVPQGILKRIKEEAAKKYGAEGIKVLGVIPENRVLLAITVGELAECIGGKILNHNEKSGELVENYMLGAMVVGSGLDYFGRKKNKAAVIREERLDMQLAALETPTSCLVLSGGNKPPAYGVLYKAESKGIPIITTETNVNDIVTNIENALIKTRLNHEKKLEKLAETVKQNLDMKAFG
jgi:BioD-like phosphotransacetylase family protein